MPRNNIWPDLLSVLLSLTFNTVNYSKEPASLFCIHCLFFRSHHFTELHISNSLARSDNMGIRPEPIKVKYMEQVDGKSVHGAHLHYLWSLCLVAECTGLHLPPTTLYSTGSISTAVPLKCNCAFWPKGCLPSHLVTSKQTTKIMQNCEGEHKWSGSLIKSCHGPLKIFSQQPRRGKYNYYLHLCEGAHSSKTVFTVGIMWSDIS